MRFLKRKVLTLSEWGERGRGGANWILIKDINNKFWDRKLLFLLGPGYQWNRKCCIKFALCEKVSGPQHQKKVEDFTSFMVQKRVLLARWFLLLFIVVWPRTCNRYFHRVVRDGGISKLMNFRKSFKRPLTPFLIFGKSFCNFFHNFLFKGPRSAT